MNPGQKKLTALALMLLLAIPVCLSVLFMVKQKVLQSTIQARFGKELIQTITVSKKNITWTKKGKEIIVEGKYFDVMYYQTTGDDVVLTGFYDNKEDKLVKEIKKLIRQKKATGSSANQLVINFLFSIAYFSQAEITYDSTWHFISNQYHLFDEKLPAPPSFSFTRPPQI